MGLSRWASLKGVSLKDAERIFDGVESKPLTPPEWKYNRKEIKVTASINAHD